MSYCLNPACHNPNNPDSNKFCHSCGLKLNEEVVFGDRYKIVKLLGQGAFGRTYLTEDTYRFNEPRVIKKFIAQLQGQQLDLAKRLFAQEAQRLYELDHPQIPKLEAYFEKNNSLYLIQHFVKGENLYQEFRQNGRFNEAQIRFLLTNLLPVIQYIHDNNVLHRDLKPENIMRNEQTQALVLIDFGGAKQTSGTIASTAGTRIFTPGYAGIEHINGYPVKQSDLFSLGATCMRLLTGCFPQPDPYNNTIDPLFDPLEGSWRWREVLQQQNSSISDNLGEILDKLLAPFAKQRYQTAEEVIAALNPVAPTILSPQPGTPHQQHLQKFVFDVVTVDRQGNINNRRRGEAEYFVLDLGRGVNLEMVAIPGGTFLMGSPENEKYSSDSERPQHYVTVPPFFMAKYPTTQAQWRAVASLPQVECSLNPDPSNFKGANRPVEQVSWYDCVEFTKRISKRFNLDCRLPSEAEWEYACRAGTTTPFYFGATLTSALANYNGNYTYDLEAKTEYRRETTNVGSFPANAFGLDDLHGNVWEWCADSWHNNYAGAPANGIEWNDNHSQKLLRGGSWNNLPRGCRSAFRNRNSADFRSFDSGFRAVVCGAW
ncbi:MAG: bifunctional serine/threonine-protein kinase/formylglycine-generating enzyme family protein [Oscillatoria sp. PMC 1068.18]|nr:bifunctional serine/threonine-protein kinase/formylglycine-generating enzyme family protein [Oscillatoria sp. PMC 1076.18]MEC4991045.1 bifunctional serine/threonine-protein kinase/formylglycine-generating enzyme family protein [Oscillatoria sp. PMC 1068.18]